MPRPALSRPAWPRPAWPRPGSPGPAFWPALAAVLALAGCAPAPGPVTTPGPGASTPPPTPLVTVSVSASPVQTPEPRPPVPPGAPVPLPQAKLDAIRADLADRGVDAAALTVVGSDAVTWPDGSLGCPEPGMAYTQALVEGMRVVVEVAGATYDYRFGTGDVPRLCPGE